MPEIALPTAAKQDEILENLKVRNENGLALKKSMSQGIYKTNQLLSQEIYKYAATKDYVYVMESKRLLKLDVKTFSVVKETQGTFRAKTYESHIKVSNNKIYVVISGTDDDGFNHTIKEIDCDSLNTLKEVTYKLSLVQGSSIAISNNYLYITGVRSGLAVISKSDLSLVYQTSEFAASYSYVEGDDIYGYYNNSGKGSIYKYTASTKKVIRNDNTKNLETCGMYVVGDVLHAITIQYFLQINKNTLEQISSFLSPTSLGTVSTITNGEFSSAYYEKSIGLFFKKFTSNYDVIGMGGCPVNDLGYAIDALQNPLADFTNIDNEYFYIMSRATLTQFKYITKHVGYEEV